LPEPQARQEVERSKVDKCKSEFETKPATGSSNPSSAAAVASLDEVAGAWSVESLESSNTNPIYDGSLWAFDLPCNWHEDYPQLVSDRGDAIEPPDLDTPPDLMSLHDTENNESMGQENEHHYVEITVGQCHDMNVRRDLPDDEDPDIAGILELDEEDDGDVDFQEAHMVQWVAETAVTMSIDREDDNPFDLMDVQALVAKWDVTWSKPFYAFSRSLALMASPPKVTNGELWDLYDSGASHHMTPIREDFMTFQATTPQIMTAANQQEFTMADGIGDVIISVPNGARFTRMHLTSVLYTPSISLTFVSIGRIDDAGYMSLFGNGQCEICRGNSELIGIIPKRQALYRVIRNLDNASAHAMKPQEVTVMDLHCRMGHITPH
jgi:hypothetical protein